MGEKGKALGPHVPERGGEHEDTNPFGWIGLARSVAGALGGGATQIRTQGGDVRGAGDDDDPVVPSIDYVATVELEELRALGT